MILVNHTARSAVDRIASVFGLQSSGTKTFPASATADRPEKMMSTDKVDPRLRVLAGVLLDDISYQNTRGGDQELQDSSAV